ncbi:MAG: hypothetical protein ACE5GW_10420, partial [Planctomycetota bacterium]
MLSPADTVELTPPHDLKSLAFRYKAHFFATQIARGKISTVVIPDWPRPLRLPGPLLTLLAAIARGLGFDAPPPQRSMASGLEVLRAAREWRPKQLIYTVAAQTYSRERLIEILKEAVRGGATGLLVVSGGAPGRRLAQGLIRLLRWMILPIPLLPALERRLMPMGAKRLLELIAEMKERGELPAELSTWAVANPFRDDLQRVEEKVELGAELILTQPPLLEQGFERWWRAAQSRDRLQGRIIVGFPMLTSPGALRFWYLLVGIPMRGEARRLHRSFSDACADRKGCARFIRSWHQRLMTTLRALPGFRAFHFMPMTHWLRLADRAFYIDAAARLQADIEHRLDTRIACPPELSERAGVARTRHRLLFCLRRLLERGVLDEEALRERLLRIRLLVTIPANTFQPVLLARRIEGRERFDCALDLRQLKGATLARISEILEVELGRLTEVRPAPAPGVTVEDFTPISRSRVLWPFNFCFWRELASFQQALGFEFDSSISGSPDTNPAFVEHLALKFLRRAGRALDARSEGRFYYLEIGTAGAVFVRLFIEKLVELAPSSGIEVDRIRSRLTYVLADYSPQVIEKAKREMGGVYRGVAVEYLTLTAGDPAEQLAERYGGRILRIHSTNVYDNLYVDRLVRLSGHTHRVGVRLYLPEESLAAIAGRHALGAAEIERGLVECLRERRDVLCFLDRFRKEFKRRGRELDFYRFWEELWASLKMAERLLPVPDLAAEAIVPGFEASGAVIERVLGDADGDLEIVVPSQAIENGCRLLSLLHQTGALEIVDICIHKSEEYAADPRKAAAMTYDGSIVFWFNAGLFARFARDAHPHLRASVEYLEEFGKPHMSILTLSGEPEEGARP